MWYSSGTRVNLSAFHVTFSMVSIHYRLQGSHFTLHISSYNTVLHKESSTSRKMAPVSAFAQTSTTVTETTTLQFALGTKTGSLSHKTNIRRPNPTLSPRPVKHMVRTEGICTPHISLIKHSDNRVAHLLQSATSEQRYSLTHVRRPRQGALTVQNFADILQWSVRHSTKWLFSR